MQNAVVIGFFLHLESSNVAHILTYTIFLYVLEMEIAKNQIVLKKEWCRNTEI